MYTWLYHLNVYVWWVWQSGTQAMNSISLYISHLSGWFINNPASLHLRSQYIIHNRSHRHTITIWPCALAALYWKPTFPPNVYDTGTSDSSCVWWKRKKHSDGSVLVNRLERISPSVLRRSSVVEIEHAQWLVARPICLWMMDGGQTKYWGNFLCRQYPQRMCGGVCIEVYGNIPIPCIKWMELWCRRGQPSYSVIMTSIVNMTLDCSRHKYVFVINLFLYNPSTRGNKEIFTIISVPELVKCISSEYRQTFDSFYTSLLNVSGIT